jgi:type IV pilus assembly protein PilO
MNLEMKGVSIPKKYRLSLIVLLGVAIVVAGYFVLLKPQFEERDRVAIEQNKAREELARLTVFRDNIEKTRKEYAQVKLDLEEALRQMPEEKEIPNLLRQVSAAAQESKTRIKYFAPKAIQAADFYSEVPFEIKYTAPYHSAGYFFDGIRKLERIIHVTSFSLESKSSSGKVILDGTCTAKAYVLPKEKPQQNTQGKKKEEKNEPSKK